MRPRHFCSQNLLLLCLAGLLSSSYALVADYPGLQIVRPQPERRSLDRRQDITNSSSSDSDPSTNSTTSYKAGLAWANGNRVDMNQFLATGKVSWYYTWSVWPATTRGSWGSRERDVELEWVPLFWGAKSIPEFQSNIGDTVRRANGSERTRVRAVLGMNEPEQPGQSNMTAQEGFDMWMQHLEPLRTQYGVRLGSPAVSSGPSGKQWMQDFLALCSGRCNIDFIALHWYGTDPDAFIAHLWDYHYAFNKTMWVTEWACHSFVNASENARCSDEGVADFMRKTQGFMDQTDWVERYAWFGALTDLPDVTEANALLDSGGEITPLGRQYVNATADQDLTSSVVGAASLAIEARWTLLVAQIGLLLWAFGLY